MPQYSSSKSNPFNRSTVTATLDTDTDTLTYTTQTPNGQTVTATVPAGTSTGSAIAALNSQLLAAGVSTGALGIDGTAVQAASAARRQAAAAQAEAQATGNPVPAAPDATPVSTAISNTATGTTPPSTAATPPPTAAPAAANADLPPALAAQQPFPSTGAVPVDVAPVPAPTVRAISDPEFNTPPDPAVERQQIAAAVAQGDEVGQGADTNLVVDRTIDPTAGEGPQTVVVTPTATPSAVDPDFALELQNLETAQANEDRRFLETALPVPPDFEDQFDANPPIEEPGEIGDEDPEVAALLEQQRAINQADVANAYSTPEPVPEEFTGYGGASFDEEKALNEALKQQAAQNTAAGQTNAAVKNAQQQNTLSARVNTPASADWRVRLSLAPTSTYLYNAQNAGILAPLKRTGGVVFPYTPQIDMAYQAKYDGVDLTHSNYRGYFYRNSSVDQVSIRAAFTAQDTREAEYLLAVITFFKSVTKMFYGAQDPNRGMPPPLVFLTGMGQYQFNNNPCVVSNFQYNLPSDVDYIRANGFNNYGINMDNRRQQGSGPPATGILGAIAQVNRLINSNLVQGMLGNNQNSANRSTNPVSANNSKTNYTNSTYVPTKMEISLTLLPIQTRSQMSAQFDLQKFSAGQLLQQPGGFW